MNVFYIFILRNASLSQLRNMASNFLASVDQDLSNYILEMLFLLLTFISTCMSACVVHEHCTKSGYMNVSDLGIAMHENDLQAVEDEVELFACDVNYDGASAVYISYDYEGNNDYENGTESEFKDDIELLGGFTPLHIGCIDGSTEAVKKLLEYPNIELENKNNEGSTPLFTAASWNLADIVIALCLKGADVNKRNNYGETPLQEAATYGNIETVKILVQFDADLNVLAGHHNETALLAAATNGFKDVVEYLADMGADLNIKDGFGRTALYWAIWLNYADIADLLEGKAAML